MTIVEFLEARLAEDEAVALACIDGPPDGGSWPDSRYEARTAELIHSRRHDPARALREVAAKRAILTEYVNENWVQEQGHRTAWTEGGQAARETALRLFASIYSDHPDYQSEWSIP
ncbi:hypothetical protein FFI94_018805 [Rhodococcus sp. KBS0724]|uniref:DUF6221 family protein n=1 Tax=Rhodococcus sp. KBS0724 TaxID=1179674 RepID=UPI00110ED639|nr:DUF6221 family protein [Rhodococcus sp. KBS0724]TSD47967.1 hypothetical protein FFI94_018805 [Rhodococcus sp. KBS0724]